MLETRYEFVKRVYVRIEERDENIQKKRKKFEKGVAKLESEILALEEEQSEITKLLENPDSYSDPDKAKELNIKAARLAKKWSEKNYEWDIETENLLKIDEDG